MRRILLSLLLGTSCAFAFSQQCTEKIILTGPQGSYPSGVTTPSNPEVGGNVSRFNWMLNPPVDGINFRFSQNTTTKYLLSPWHVSDPNLDYYKLARGTLSDYKPADGWEVFKVNLGRLNDDVTQRMGPTLVPYIMLYNRYTGILRLFGYLDRASDYHQMVIKVTYDNPTQTNGLNVSALLSLNDEVHQPLDTKSGVKEIKAITKYANNQNIFFWTDFPLAYDPCVCLYKSNLSVTFKAITWAEVNLKGSIVGSIVPIANESGTNVLKFASGVINIGKAIYTGNFTDLSDAIKNSLSIFNLSAEFQAAIGSFADLVQMGATIESISDPVQKERMKKTLAAVSTFFASQAKSPGSASMALTATAVLNGTTMEEFDFANSQIRISTPGSKESHLNPQENYNNVADAFGNVRPEYVAFNEILGTFALLKTPAINVSYTQTDGGPPYYWHPDLPFYVQNHRIRFTIPKQYVSGGTQLNNILYAFNPIMHPNLANTKIKVGFVVRKKLGGNPSMLDKPYTLNSGILNNQPLVNLTSVTEKYPNLTHVMTPYSYDGENIDGYRHSWVPNDKNSEEFRTYEFITPLVPLDYIYDLQAEMNLFGANFLQDDIYGFTFGPSVDEVRLKFYIDFESTDIGSNGQPNKSNLIFTYPMKLNVVGEFPVNGTIDYTSPRPPINPLSSTQVNQYCQTGLENSTYKANEALRSAADSIPPKLNTPQKTPTSITSAIIYPNPSSGNLYLEYLITVDSEVSFSVYTMHMQKVMGEIRLGRHLKGKYKKAIKLSNLPAGIYILRLNMNGKTANIKVIIQ